MNLRRRQQPAPDAPLKGESFPAYTARMVALKGQQPVRSESSGPRSLGDQLRAQIYQLQQDALDRARESVVKARRIANLEADLRQAADTICDREEAMRAKDGRIVRLEGEKANLEQRLEGYTRRVAELEHTVNQLALAAHERQDLHAEELADMAARFGSLGGEVVRLKAELAAAGRPESTDPEPTGPLPSDADVARWHADRNAQLDPGRDAIGYWQCGQWFPDAGLQVPTIVGGQTRTDALPDFPTPWQTGAWGPRSSGGQSAPVVGEP